MAASPTLPILSNQSIIPDSDLILKIESLSNNQEQKIEIKEEEKDEDFKENEATLNESIALDLGQNIKELNHYQTVAFMRDEKYDEKVDDITKFPTKYGIYDENHQN